MQKERNTADNEAARDESYHDAHLHDPEEWDEASAEPVHPRPSGMAVFSLRLPYDEFNQLKQEAERRSTTMSELTRTALRGYLQPRVNVSLSWAASISGLQIWTHTEPWQGGIGWYGENVPQVGVPADQSAQQGRLPLPG